VSIILAVRSRIAVCAAVLALSAGIYVGGQFLWEHPHFFPDLVSGHVGLGVLERQRLHFPTGITDGSFAIPETSVAWNADGSRLATLGKVRVTIWDANSWTKLKEISVFAEQRITGQSMAFLPDGSLLVPASNSSVHRPGSTGHKAIEAWNPETGASVRKYPDAERSPPDFVKSINDSNDNFAVSRDGKFVAGILFNSVYLYNVATGEVLYRWAAPDIPGPPPQPDRPQPRDGFLAVAFAPDGSEVAVCGFSGRIYFLNAADGQLRRAIVGFDDRKWCTALAFSADGKFLSAGGGIRQIIPGDQRHFDRDESVRVWRIADSSVLASFAGGMGSVRTLAWSGSENILAAGDDGSLRWWRIESETQPLIFYRRVKSGVLRIAFSTQGQLASAEGNYDVVIYR
jgi:WD40 repeat protein